MLEYFMDTFVIGILTLFILFVIYANYKNLYYIRAGLVIGALCTGFLFGLGALTRLVLGV